MDYRSDILHNFGDAALQVPELSFVISNEVEFKQIMDAIGYRPNVVLETGTASGCSALMLLQYANKVVTFDIKEVSMKYDIWRHYGVLERVKAFVVKETSEIPGLLTEDFDFAFVDGDHSYEGCAKDILIVEKCGRILFHDIYHPPIIQAINELRARKGGSYIQCGPTFGYWSDR